MSVSKRVWYIWGSPESDHVRLETQGWPGSEVIMLTELIYNSADRRRISRVLAVVTRDRWLKIAEELKSP